jgi:hypothetical protein
LLLSTVIYLYFVKFIFMTILSSAHASDLAKKTEAKDGSAGPLPELIVENLDKDQIWEEIRLQNDALLRYADPVLEKLQEVEGSESAEQPEADADAGGSEENVSEEGGSAVEGLEDGEEAEDEDEEDAEGFGFGDEGDSDEAALEAALDRAANAPTTKQKQQKPQSGKRGSSVDSGFFKLEDMQKFADDAEEEEERRNSHSASRQADEDEDDEDDDDGSGAANIRYEDFFGERPM